MAMDDEPLKATLMLIRAYDKDVSFEIDVKYLTEGAEDLVTVNPAIVTIPAGEKSVDFEIISNKKGVVADKVQLEIGVKYPLPEADMGRVEEVLRVVVKPYMEAEDLTEEQVRTIVREEWAAQEAKRNNAEASGWAVEYIQRAIQAGILTGVDDGKGGLTIASPQGPAIRQEMAAMGVAILEAVKKELGS